MATHPILSVSSVQLLSRIQLLATSWTAGYQASLSVINSRSLPKLMSIELVMPSSHLILSHPLLLPSSIFPSVRVFPMSQFSASGGQSIGVSASESPSNEYSGLISFRMDWLDLLAVQDSQKSSPTPQFKSINSSVLSFLYSPTHIPTGKSIALTRWTFVDKVMSLLLNMLSNWS